MPKTSKVKKKVTKAKSKTVSKPKTKQSVNLKKQTRGQSKFLKLTHQKIMKSTCVRNTKFFQNEITRVEKRISKSNNEALYNGSMDDNSISADIVDKQILILIKMQK